MKRNTAKRFRGGWKLTPPGGSFTKRKAAIAPQRRPFHVEEALKDSKFAKSKVTPGVRAALADQRYDQILEKSKTKRATAAQVESEPVFQPKEKKDGTMERPNYPGVAIFQKMGKSVFKGIISSETIVFEDKQQPPRPICLEYDLHQTGNSKYLRERKREFGSTSLEIPLPNLTVSGADTDPLEDLSYLIQNSTCCGHNRANVHWPYSWHDYCNPQHSLTAQQGCFTRQQLRSFLIKQIKETSPASTTWAEAENALEQILDQPGDVRQYFAFESVECEYKYMNNNLSLPMYLSLYVNTPTRDLPLKNDPLYDWFQPWTAEADQDDRKMPVEYRYFPQLTASNELMYSISSSPPYVVQNPDFTTDSHRNSILTVSTEVVPEATPMGFSQRFRDHWHTLTVQKVLLQPQQELKVRFKVHLSQMLDCRRFLRQGTEDVPMPQFFEELTLFPIVKFWGEDTVAVSQNLRRTGATANALINDVVETTAPRSGPCLLSESQTCRVRARINAAIKNPITSGSPDIIWNNWFVNISAKVRELFPSDDYQRGVTTPYYRCNNNVGIFCNKTGEAVPTPPVGTSPALTTLCAIDSKTSTVSPTTGPTVAQIKPADYVRDWNYATIETVARTTSRRTQSEVSAAV